MSAEEEEREAHRRRGAQIYAALNPDVPVFVVPDSVLEGVGRDTTITEIEPGVTVYETPTSKVTVTNLETVGKRRP